MTREPRARLFARELIGVLPLALLAVATGAATHLWAVTVVVLVVLIVSAAGARVRIDTFGQLALSLLAIGTATIVTATVAPGLMARRAADPGPAWTFLALTGLFLSLPRLFYARPVGGPRTTAAFGLLTALALGGTPNYAGGTLFGFLTGSDGPRSVRPYVELLVLYGALQLLALMASDPAWTGVFTRLQRSRRLLVMSVLVGTLAAILAVPLAIGLPLAHDWAVKKLLGDDTGTRSGFSDYARLGSLHDMLLSDTLALRLQGLPAPYLRGMVYSHYFDGQWSSAIGRSSGPVTLPPASFEPHADQVVVHYAKSDESHLFLPLGATILASEPRTIELDEFGIAVTTSGGVERLAFGFLPRQDRSDTLRVDPAAPTVEDLRVPERIQSDLRRIANGWTTGLTNPRFQVEALVARFADDFVYSLDFDRPSDVDPVIAFLDTDRQGHCEYFASALTLLCRTLGIPARMVAGYLVSEQNPLTGDWVVRDRDAHAWTEVWLDGAWRTFDATPGGATLARDGMSWFAAVLDAIRVWAARGWQAVQQVSLTTAAFVLAGLGAVLLLFQWFRRKRRAAVAVPPALAQLLSRLEPLGLQRAPSETLERFAARLRTAGQGEVANAILVYAEARYSGGDTTVALEALGRAQLTSAG